MVLARLTISIHIPNWMDEPTQDDCLEQLDKCPLHEIVEGAVRNALRKTKRLNLSEVTVED